MFRFASALSTRFAAPVSRSFSTQTAKRPPLIAGENAEFIRSMFDHCKENNTLKETRAGIHKFMDYLEVTRDSGAIDAFINPTFDEDQRQALISHYLEQLQCNTDEVATWFYTVAEQKLYANLSALASEFDKLVTYESKEVYASVTSAEPLDQATVDRLTAVMKNQIQADETLILEQKVDPDIIGGLVITLDDKILDHSVRSSLDKLDNNKSF